MKTRNASLLIAAACLLLATSAVAQPSLEAGVGGTANFPIDAVLYDQLDNAAGNGAPDQDFEAAFNAYDAEGADDFEVDWPDGWSIEQVNTVGTTGGSATTVDVNFYPNSAGGGNTDLPGDTAICSYLDLTSFTDTDGSLSIDLPDPCKLLPGFYWVAIQVQQDFGTDGQHFWSNRSVQSFSESVWRNPNGGFGIPACTDWAPQASVCGVGGGVGPDFLFQLVGQFNEPEVTVTEIPTLGQVGLVMLLLSLLGAGLYRLRRR